MLKRALSRTSATTAAAILALAGLLSPVTSAVAAEPNTPTAEELSESILIQQRLAELKIAGKTDAEISARLRLVKVTEGGKTTTSGGNAGPGDDMSITVDQNSVTLYIDAIYYESQTGRYYVSSNFRWNCNNNCWGAATHSPV